MTKGESQAAGLDLQAELDAILDLGRRAPGSDAERRTALHLRERLEELGRTAEVEPLPTYTGWPLAYALLAATTVAAGVLAIYEPVAGAALALAAALLTFLDAGMQIPTVRRLLGRRASQNVISWADAGKPGAIVVVAHYDAGRAGLAHTDANARRKAALSGLIRRPIGGLQPVFWAELAVLACTLLRLVGLDGTAVSAVQFVPTLLLIVAVALLADIALSGTKAGENDNASGCVLALRLTERYGDSLQHFDLHVLFTGAQKAGAAGMRAFLRRHHTRLRPDTTVFVNVDEVGSGAVRYTRREGALVTLRSHPQLTSLCDDIAEDDESAEPIVNRSASDATAAGAAGFPAITVTCRDRLDYASGRVDERALEAAEGFCAELIERLDAEVGPSIVAPVEATALSEPD
jgi:Peptidase family M28